MKHLIVPESKKLFYKTNHISKQAKNPLMEYWSKMKERQWSNETIWATKQINDIVLKSPNKVNIHEPILI